MGVLYGVKKEEISSDQFTPVALKRIDSVGLNDIDTYFDELSRRVRECELPMADIFISYAHQDRDSVTKIAGALADRHVSVWSDQKIRAGEEWMPEIEKALTEAKVLVLCVPPSFLASDWAQFEIGVALSRSRDSGVRVVPLILRDSDIPQALNRFPYVDARNLSPDQVAATIQKVVEASRQ